MSSTVLRVIELLFGCWHRNLSRPFTVSGWTYKVCLTCGKKFAYDRADIGCVTAQRRDAIRREPQQEDYARISFVSAEQQERVKVA